MFDLTDRTALVTGATGGDRRRHCPRHACQGRCDRDFRPARRPARCAGGATGRARPRVACDIADKTDVEALVPAAEQAMGHLDILVNNAGITRDQIFMRMRTRTGTRCSRSTSRRRSGSPGRRCAA